MFAFIKMQTTSPLMISVSQLINLALYMLLKIDVQPINYCSFIVMVVMDKVVGYCFDQAIFAVRFSH